VSLGARCIQVEVGNVKGDVVCAFDKFEQANLLSGSVERLYCVAHVVLYAYPTLITQNFFGQPIPRDGLTPERFDTSTPVID
jgi:hypothetical protein